MKKTIFILIMSFIMLSCDKVKTDVKTKVNNSEVKCPYESYEFENMQCKITYNDSILILTDYHPEAWDIYDNKNIGDTVINTIENIIYKDIEVHSDNLGGSGKIGYFITRIFYHWKTQQVYMVIENINNITEIYGGSSITGFWKWADINTVENYYNEFNSIQANREYYKSLN